MIVGTIPLPVPGLHMSLRIGLAGGPLLAAIILSQWGNLGSVVWYMPVAANALFRDFGLAVFLACVGFDAGGGLWQQIVHGGGLRFMMWGRGRNHPAGILRRLLRAIGLWYEFHPAGGLDFRAR